MSVGQKLAKLWAKGNSTRKWTWEKNWKMLRTFKLQMLQWHIWYQMKEFNMLCNLSYLTDNQKYVYNEISSKNLIFGQILWFFKEKLPYFGSNLHILIKILLQVFCTKLLNEGWKFYILWCFSWFLFFLCILLSAIIQ